MIEKTRNAYIALQKVIFDNYEFSRIILNWICGFEDERLMELSHEYFQF
jgi:hypothetical protein